MTYKMTPERQKLLTEMIGECWHEFPSKTKCKCGMSLFSYPTGKNFHRTFTTDTDMMKVFRWLKTGTWVDWFNFKDFVKVKWEKDFWERKEELREPFEYWLMSDAERFCCLVAQAKLEGVI
jgi:hypothetical protein